LLLCFPPFLFRSSSFSLALGKFCAVERDGLAVFYDGKCMASVKPTEKNNILEITEKKSGDNEKKVTKE
jgi:hypothetical protein